MKKLVLILILFISFSAFSQKYSYAVITITERELSKKFNVEVDLGDTPLQIQLGKGLSEKLNKIKSQAAVLNFMSEEGFELFDIKDISSSYNGSGGSRGVVLIMRKEEQ